MNRGSLFISGELPIPYRFGCCRILTKSDKSPDARGITLSSVGETPLEGARMTTDRNVVESISVIGAGQAGLATGYLLREFGLDFSIYADDERVGDSWRNRWDSLRLFTPAFYNNLPGLGFPADDPAYLPFKDEMADYLEAYAEEFDLPVRRGTRVTSARRQGGAFRLETTAGSVKTECVVVATGAYQQPDIPPVSEELPDDLLTIHSSEYANPSRLVNGDVLVVGAGNSGTQIATEIAEADHTGEVWLVGPDRGRIPRTILGRDFYRWVGPTLMRLKRTGILGRRLFERMAGRGDPVFKNEFEKMQEAGVQRVTGRVTSVEDGRPSTAEGERFDVDTVVWCTGFLPEFSWIELDVFRETGYPRHTRGVVTEAPGLYFVGLPWLHRPNSSLIGGVGRDAEHVARQIRDHVHEG